MRLQMLVMDNDGGSPRIQMEGRLATHADPKVHIGPAPDVSDAELARRAQGGDTWAEEAIYRRYAAVVLRTARRLSANSSDAEDISQETFTIAFGIWGQLREPDRLKSWLLQIAVRRAHRRFRHKKLLRALGLLNTVDDATLHNLAGAACSAEARAELALLDRVLNDVSVESRMAWMLRHVEGLSLDEVAFECQCSLATAKRRVSRCQARIDEAVRRGAFT